MDKSQLRGASLFALVLTALMIVLLISAGERWSSSNLLALLGVAVVGLPIGYYLWPTVTFFGDLYRGRGYTLRPSLLRVAWTIAMATAQVLISVLLSRLGGELVLWTDLLRVAMIAGAFFYLIFLPPRDAPPRPTRQKPQRA